MVWYFDSQKVIIKHFVMLTDVRLTNISEIMVECSAVVRKFVALNPGQVRPKTSIDLHLP